MAWTFNGVNPTVFNVISDLLGLAVRTIFAFAIGYVFVYLMSSHLRKGHSIPAKVLGKVPSDFASSCLYAFTLKFSGPVLILALLLCLGDFSHSIADLGLSFVTVNMAGPPGSVLLLDQRNPTRLFELSGDPAGPRTRAVLESSAIAGFQGYVNVSQARRDLRLLRTFLIAVDDISGGGSPLVEYNEIKEADLNYHGVDVTSFTGGDDKPLARMKLEVPLNCATESMKAITQTLNANYSEYVGPPRVPLNNNVLIPDCDFSMLRSSGVYNSRKDHAEILEHMSTVYPSAGYTLIHPGGLDPNTTPDFLGQVFRFTPTDKALARDRDDWRKGRAIPNVSGIKIGDMLVQFNSTVLASGNFQQELLASDGTLEQFRSIFLVSNVLGECPPLPSGRSSYGLECLVVTQLHCQSVFQEELVPFIPSDFHNQGEAEAEALRFLPSTARDDFCEALRSRIIWGRNFVVDDEFLATVSGALTNVKVDVFDGVLLQAAVQYSALAALFALATTGEMASVQSQVSPQINVLFIIFLFLPLSVTAAVFIATFKASKMPVPTEGWQLLVLGREEEKIPTRNQKESEFPMEASKNYELSISNDGQAGQRSSGGILSINQVNSTIAGDRAVALATRHDEKDFSMNGDLSIPYSGLGSKQVATFQSMDSGHNQKPARNDPPGQDVRHGASVLSN